MQVINHPFRTTQVHLRTPFTFTFLFSTSSGTCCCHRPTALSLQLLHFTSNPENVINDKTSLLLLLMPGKHLSVIVWHFSKSCLKPPFDLCDTLQPLPPAPVGWCFLWSCVIKSAASLCTACSCRGWESTAQRGKAPHSLSNSNVLVSFAASASDTLSHHSSTCGPSRVHPWPPCKHSGVNGAVRENH